MLGIDEVVLAVLAGIDADPVEGAAEGVVTDRVVVADRRARIAADAGGLGEVVAVDVCAFDTSAADLLTVDIQRAVTALAGAATVVGELDPNPLRVNRAYL
jgi:hypothetical protein